MINDAFAVLMDSFALGYWGAFGIIVLMMLESMPVVGLFLPGIFIMTGLGSLSGTVYLSFADCVLYATIGALLGDSMGYWLGYLGVGQRFLHPGGKRSRRSRDRAEQLLKRYGRLAVFLGRFIWFFHPAVPFIAGVMRIRPGWFYLADVPAVLLWVLLYAGIGHWATGLARERTLEFMVALGILLVLLGAVLLVRYLEGRRDHKKTGKKRA